MRALNRIGGIGLVFTATLALAAPVASARPPEGPARGSFRDGSLVGGARLPDEGLDHYLLFPPRCAGATLADANAWGHPALVAAVLAVAREVRGAVPSAGRLPVGDASASTGGKIPHHLSHQNGLDVDVFFVQRTIQPPSALTAVPAPLLGTELTRCTYGPSYEQRDPVSQAWGVTAAFDRELAWTLAERFAARPEVQVIFVGTLLRAELARWAKAHGVGARERSRTLGKLYPVFCRTPKGVVIDSYRGNWCPHDDHLHVRLRCPKDSPTCRAR